MGNFIIDSLVIILCFFVFKPEKPNLREFYKESVLKVWVFGFVADIVGTLVLLGISISNDFLGLPAKVISAISFDPFSDPLAITLILFAMLVSSLLIFLFNYWFTFSKLITEKGRRAKVSMSIAIITIPWTFLLPTKWFYHGF